MHKILIAHNNSLYTKSIYFLVCAILLNLLFFKSTLSAHRINIFCWVQDKKIACKSNFSNGGAVKNCKVDVLNYPQNKLLLSGKTNNQGEFTFKIPEEAQKEAWDLKILCRADMGHQNFWIVRADEFNSEAGNNFVQKRNEPKIDDITAQLKTEQLQGVGVSELKDIIAKELEQKLTPIMRELKKMQIQQVNLQDIIGGIGYVVGIMGIIFYYKSRGK